MSVELQKKLDDLGTAVTEFRKLNDKEIAETKAGIRNAATKESLEKAEKHIQSLELSIEEMKAAMNRSAQGGTPEQKEDKEAIAYKNAIVDYLRKGKELTPEMVEFGKKALSVDSDEDGGFFVTPQLSTEIIGKVYESSPIRQLASVQTISTDALEFIEDLDEAGSGWVGEVQARTETTTPQIKKISIPVHELYAEPKATQKFLDDAAVNVEAWLSGKVSEKFARDEAAAFVNGNGVNKPKGILAYGAGDGFGLVERVETAANNVLVGDDFISIQMMLKDAYQNNASWLINRLLIGAIRKLKDLQGQYIWQPGLTAGQPNQLLAKPVYMATHLPSAVTANTDSIIYGDIKAGYQVVDRVGIRVLRDPYTSKPFVKFYTTKRVGGGVKNFEAMKVLKVKA